MHLLAYIELFRFKIGGYSDYLANKEVFLAWGGKTLVQSDMTNIISLELCNAGYQFRATFSKLRKMTVSMLLSNEGTQEEAMHLAKFMPHNQSTQQRIYDLSGSSVNSTRMSELVSRMVHGDEIRGSDLTKATKDGGMPGDYGDDEGTRPTAIAESAPTDGGMSESDDGDVITMLLSVVHRRKRYSVQQKTMLRKTFGTLAKKLIITTAEVASLLMKNRDVLAKMAKHHDMPMKSGKLITKSADVVRNLK